MMENTLNNGMCRCCASEGTFKDVKSSYNWMGEEEIYSEMLKECFDITLFSSENGDDGGICEVCITQLRNAANFKKQVQNTEEQFKRRLEDNLFKPSIVKLESKEDDESDNLSDGFSADFEVPIKMESPDEGKTKKRAAKATTSRAKKAKVDDGETSTKRGQRSTEKKDSKMVVLEHPIKIIKAEPEAQRSLKSRELSISKVKTLSQLDKQRAIVKEIMLNSNATLIRDYKQTGYGCRFCTERFLKPADLKTHTIDQHNEITEDLLKKGVRRHYDLLNLDITGLKCKICETALESVVDLILHLTDAHKKSICKDVSNYLISFKFNDDLLSCLICDDNFQTFPGIVKHMTTKHYRNFVCDICDAGFINKYKLVAHLDTHKTGCFKCRHCDKKFDTFSKKKSHEVNHQRSSRPNKCDYCVERFSNSRRRNAHLSEVHGICMPKVQCQECEKTFLDKRQLTTHVKRHHLLLKHHKCTICEKAFFSPAELREHMVRHSGLKPFSCKVCNKLYPRMKTLKEHMRIHENDRRFKCTKCGQAFVQKCSLKGHMKSKHGESI